MSSFKLKESWLLLGYIAVIFIPWAQLRAQFLEHGKFNAMGLFEDSA